MSEEVITPPSGDLEPIEPSVGCESRGPIQSPAGGGGCAGGGPNPNP